MTVQPTLQTSERSVAPDILITSGAIQYGVPTTSRTAPEPMVEDCVWIATPKSARRTSPSWSTRMLAALMSRWMHLIPELCR